MERSELHAAIVSPETRRLLIAYARRRVGNPADVEDVVQDALLSAARAADAFEARSSAMRWLYQIVTNAGRMQRRALRRVRRGGNSRHVPLDEVPEPMHWETPETRLMSREELSMVIAELATLPDVEQELVSRFAVEDISLEALAADTNITRSAAKSRMYRARRVLSLAAGHPCEP